uniref:C-type lectin domain-containing protein n=1 Tax=Acrobeloides nanus TaxID=290746 RepID=A0A914DIF2_9BILA
MWQADTFNPTLIDKEFGFAEDLGMYSMRIFLHDLAYSQDPTGFKSRLNTVLGLAAKHGLRPMITFFDSCWNPYPVSGKQPQPTKGTMLSAWSQSPGAKSLLNSTDWARLKTYVTDVIGTFANDNRVLIWDLWNEPENTNGGSYNHVEPPNKVQLVDQLLPQVFDWARSVNPIQPLTSAPFGSDYLKGQWTPTEQIQVNNSDVITFHNYAPPSDYENHIVALQKLGRPVICSEYMARPTGSTFVTHLPIGKKYNVGMYNWAFVNGKTECNLPWDSWQNPYVQFQPQEWFHEVFRKDGTPYLVEETNLIKRYNGCPKGYQSSVDNWTCYYGSSSPLSWADAEVTCRAQGAYLATVNSVFENADIASYLSKNYSSCNSFSIGLYSHYGDWIWSNYATSTFRFWKSGYPTNDTNALCVVLNQDGSWSNQPCTNTQCYVCSF